MRARILNKITTSTGIALVIANMIGTGAFTSLGFQLSELQNPNTIIILWILGGILALCGAFSYAELGSHISKSGGEYIFLSEIFHPFLGYLSGWISITVGFAAPIALSAIAVIEYFPYFNFSLKWSSIFLVAIITLIHSVNLNTSAKFQNISTVLKVVLILILIIIGFILPAKADAIINNGKYSSEIFSSAFVISLIYVSYSYSGWNAAVYIIDEFKHPKKSVPKALIIGTLTVTIIYTLLQFIFLKMATLNQLAGQLNIGHIVSNNMFGTGAADVFSLVISLLLISGISAMVWVGSRVTSSMAKDYPLWHYFDNKKGTVPKKALWLQFIITALILITGTFEQVLIYCGFLLTLSSMLTVIGVFKLRSKTTQLYGSAFKSPLYPIPQIVFLIFSTTMVLFSIHQYPYESALGITNIVIGMGSWFLNKRIIIKQ